MPFYGQRILSTILDRNSNFVKVLRELVPTQTQSGKHLKGLIQVICEFYMVNHPNLNKNTIKIVKALMQAKELSFNELRDYRIIEKTYQLIKTMLANKQEWCIELLLDINHDLLSRFNDVVKTEEKEIGKLIDDIFSNFDICV